MIEDGDYEFDELGDRRVPGEAVTTVRHLTKRDGESYDKFVERAMEDPIASEVNRADTEDNLDVTRLDSVDPSMLDRIEKYHQSCQRLAAANTE